MNYMDRRESNDNAYPIIHIDALYLHLYLYLYLYLYSYLPVSTFHSLAVVSEDADTRKIDSDENTASHTQR